MGYTIAIILFTTIPTVAAVLFVMNRPHLSTRQIITTFAIWLSISVPLGVALLVLTFVCLWVTNYVIWGSEAEGLLLIIVAPQSIGLSVALVLLADFRNQRSAERLGEKPQS